MLFNIWQEDAGVYLLRTAAGELTDAGTVSTFGIQLIANHVESRDVADKTDRCEQNRKINEILTTLEARGMKYPINWSSFIGQIHLISANLYQHIMAIFAFLQIDFHSLAA